MPQLIRTSTHPRILGGNRDKDGLSLLLLLSDRYGEVDGYGGSPIDDLCGARVGVAGGDGLSRRSRVVGDGNDDEVCWAGQKDDCRRGG